MITARSALALAVLLSGIILISARDDEESKSLESWEIEEEKELKREKENGTSTEATPATGRKILRGFVTPRPFVVDHPLFSSTWAAWSAWSFCVNNVRIRVRACNTVRGFSCVGKNQETEPCANSLYHHHPSRPASHSDYDVVDPYEEDRVEALKQLYPDENPADVLERRRPNPNFLRIGTTTSAPKKESDQDHHTTSIEKTEEIEEKEEKEAGQTPDADFKAKGTKTETQEVPLHEEIEGALEKLEVHRESETRRQHSSSYHILNEKPTYAHDGSMGPGYTLVRGSGNSFSSLDLLEDDSATKSSNSSPKHKERKDKNGQEKIQKSKAALNQISQLLDDEISALEKKVTTRPGAKASGLRAVFESRGEEVPADTVDNETIIPKDSKLAGAYVGRRSAIYDEAILDTNKASYDEYEEWIGDDKTSKEIINTRTNLKKGSQHDSASSIPLRPKASRTTVQTGATASLTATTAPSVDKQKKINFDHSQFLKEVLTADSDYADVTSEKKDAIVSERFSLTTVPPTQEVTSPTVAVTVSRNEQLNKVHELENLLGLPHQGLMDETVHPQTNPVVWATPSPQFRSEGGGQRRKKVLTKINRARVASKVDVDNVEVDKSAKMIDSDDRMYDGDARIATTTFASVRTIKKKVLKNRVKFREQPTLVDNDDFSGVKGFSPYPSMRKPLHRGPPKNKAVSFGVTGKRHRSILDEQKGQAIIKSHKMLFSKRNNLRQYLRSRVTATSRKQIPINDDTVRALDWMMQSIGAVDLTAKKPNKYSHARVNSHARAEITEGIQHATRKTFVVDSVAIGNPVTQKKVVHRPSKILPPRRKLTQKGSGAFTKLHDSDLLFNSDQEGISRMKPLRKSVHGKSRGSAANTTPLPAYPPDLQAALTRQKSLPPVLEGQPLNLLPPPLDEADDQVRHPRNGAYGTGFELDGSSPDAAAYLAAQGTARPHEPTKRAGVNRARGVKTVTGVENKRRMGGAYTSTSGVAPFPSKLNDNKVPPRPPIAGLPGQYLKGGSKIVDSDSFGPKKEIAANKPAPFVMHDASMDERNTIAAEIERLEQLVNDNKEHFNAPTLPDKGSPLALPKEFEPLLSDPRLFEDALKEIREENKAMGITADELLAESAKERSAASSSNKIVPRWSAWGDWGECLCGKQLRTRACETAEGVQVSGCKGTSYESQTCTRGTCPVS